MSFTCSNIDAVVATSFEFVVELCEALGVDLTTTERTFGFLHLNPTLDAVLMEVVRTWAGQHGDIVVGREIRKADAAFCLLAELLGVELLLEQAIKNTLGLLFCRGTLFSALLPESTKHRSYAGAAANAQTKSDESNWRGHEQSEDPVDKVQHVVALHAAITRFQILPHRHTEDPVDGHA